MVLMGELASFFIIAAIMGRRSAAEAGGSLLDLLYWGRINDGDLDLALRLVGDEDLLVGGEGPLLGEEEGDDGGVEISVESVPASSSDISSIFSSIGKDLEDKGIE